MFAFKLRVYNFCNCSSDFFVMLAVIEVVVVVHVVVKFFSRYHGSSSSIKCHVYHQDEMRELSLVHGFNKPNRPSDQLSIKKRIRQLKYHQVGGRRHTPVVCTESREHYTSHYPSNEKKQPTNYSYQPVPIDR